MAYIKKDPLCAWLSNMGVSDFIIRRIQSEVHFPAADVVEVTRCKNCKFARKMVSGDYSCLVDHRIAHNEDDYCSCGERTPKERGADKPKVTCLNCKHLEITLPYGECSRQLRIVNPDDTCEYAEPKERGGEK